MTFRFQKIYLEFTDTVTAESSRERIFIRTMLLHFLFIRWTNIIESCDIPIEWALRKRFSFVQNVSDHFRKNIYRNLECELDIGKKMVGRITFVVPFRSTELRFLNFLHNLLSIFYNIYILAIKIGWAVFEKIGFFDFSKFLRKHFVCLFQSILGVNLFCKGSDLPPQYGSNGTRIVLIPPRTTFHFADIHRLNSNRVSLSILVIKFYFRNFFSTILRPHCQNCRSVNADSCKLHRNWDRSTMLWRINESRSSTFLIDFYEKLVVGK